MEEDFEEEEDQYHWSLRGHPRKLKRYRENHYHWHCDPIHNKLPDEVLGLILMKFSDPKSLLRCSLSFPKTMLPAILFQSQSLSLRLPSSLLVQSHHLPPEYPDDRFFKDALLLGLTKLVSRFTTVRSLHIELSCQCPQLPFTPNHRSSWDRGYIEQEITCSMHYTNSIYPLLLLLVSQQPDIKSVEIMDSKKTGRSVSKENNLLIKLKKHMSNSIPRGNSKLVPGYFFTVWYVPELVLPLSGFVMKRVTLGVGAENRIKGLAHGFWR